MFPVLWDSTRSGQGARPVSHVPGAGRLFPLELSVRPTVSPAGPALKHKCYSSGGTPGSASALAPLESGGAVPRVVGCGCGRVTGPHLLDDRGMPLPHQVPMTTRRVSRHCQSVWRGDSITHHENHEHTARSSEGSLPHCVNMPVPVPRQGLGRVFSL